MALTKNEVAYIKALGNYIYELRKENKHLRYWLHFFILIVLGAIIMVFGLAMIGSINPSENAQVKLMMDKCCDGVYCTDTYYSEEDYLCHLTLCEHSFFMTNCTYSPSEE